MLNNIKDHLAYMTTTMKYLQGRIKEEPKMLEIGAETTKIVELGRYSDLTISAADELKAAARSLKNLFKEVSLYCHLRIGSAFYVLTLVLE